MGRRDKKRTTDNRTPGEGKIFGLLLLLLLLFRRRRRNRDNEIVLPPPLRLAAALKSNFISRSARVGRSEYHRFTWDA